MALAIVYFLSLFILGTSIVVANETTLFANYGGNKEASMNGLNAFLWSSVGVLSFIFAACVVYFITSAVRRRKYSEPVTA